ncbi:MAG: hypothetical protein RLZZ272_1321, partial [Actinomycetota bacterium]
MSPPDEVAPRVVAPGTRATLAAGETVLLIDH